MHHLSLGNGRIDKYVAPELPNSSTPALLGGDTLKELGAVIDPRNRKLFLWGPGGYEITLSPGSEAYDLEDSQKGHLMLPCSKVFAGRNSPNTEPIVFTVGAPSEPARSWPRSGNPKGFAHSEHHDAAHGDTEEERQPEPWAPREFLSSPRDFWEARSRNASAS